MCLQPKMNPAGPFQPWLVRKVRLQSMAEPRFGAFVLLSRTGADKAVRAPIHSTFFNREEPCRELAARNFRWKTLHPVGGAFPKGGAKLALHSR